MLTKTSIAFCGGVLFNGSCFFRILLLTWSHLFVSSPLLHDFVDSTGQNNLLELLESYFMWVVNGHVVVMGVLVTAVALLSSLGLWTSGLWSSFFNIANYINPKNWFVYVLMMCSTCHTAWLFYLVRTLWVQDFWPVVQLLQLVPATMLWTNIITKDLFVLANKSRDHNRVTNQEPRVIGIRLKSQMLTSVHLVFYIFTMVYVAYHCNEAWSLPLLVKVVIVQTGVGDVINRVYTAKVIYDFGKHIRDRSDGGQLEKAEMVNCVETHQYTGEQFKDYRAGFCGIRSKIAALGPGHELVIHVSELKFNVE